MGMALFLIGFVVLLVGFISIIKPIKKLKIKTRNIGASVFFVGLAMFITGAIVQGASIRKNAVVAIDDADIVPAGTSQEAERAEKAERVKEAQRAREAERVREAERMEAARRVQEARRLSILKMEAERAGYDSVEKYESAKRTHEAAKQAEEKRFARRGIRLTAGVKRTLAGVIDSGGYNCPSITVAYPDRETNRGRAIRVFCGPRGKNLMIWEYRVTRRPNGLYLVDPCGFWSCKPDN